MQGGFEFKRVSEEVEKKSSGRLTPQVEEDARLKHDSQVSKVRI